MNHRIRTDDGKVTVNILRRAGKVQLDALANFVVFITAEEAALLRLEQPVPLKEHGVDAVVIFPRQFRRHGQDLIVCDGSLALAAEELIERHLQRVDKLRQQRDVGTADIALPFGNGLIAHAESVCQCLLRESFIFAVRRDTRAHCQFFQLSNLSFMCSVFFALCVRPWPFWVTGMGSV